MSNQHERAVASMKQLVAEFVVSVSNRTALLTVTAIALDKKRQNGLVYMSVFPETAERPALAFLNRRQKALREFLKPRVRLRLIPRLEFVLDEELKNFHRVSAALAKEKLKN